jgi:hypothetical protein
MAQALKRAAERFEAQAATLEAQDAARHKARPGDDSLVIARTLMTAARQLRTWTGQCLPDSESAIRR